MDLIREVVEEWMKKKYGERREDVIYAHYLERPIYMVDHEAKVSNAMVIGELIHAGIEAILGPAPQVCRNITVSPVSPVPEASRFIKGGTVTVCGSADALWEGRPVEVKTTRRSSAPPWEWVHRARLYGYLYGSRPLLVVINVVNGNVRTYDLDPYSEDEVKNIIEQWLSGLWPRRTLFAFTSNPA